MRRGRPWRGSPAWRERGEQPDYRFSLANERTFLAWIRTSLALMAASVAVVQLLPRFAAPGSRHGLGIVLALLGSILAATSYYRWAANERAMRDGRPLPHSRSVGGVSVALSLIGVVLICLVAASG